MIPEPCPMAPLVEAARDGRVTDREAASLRRHLATCASCSALAAELDRVRALLHVPPRSPLEQQRARLALLRAAARPRPSPRRTSPGARLALIAALAVALASAWLVARSAPPRPARLARLPAIPRLAPVRTETVVVPEGTATFTRSATGGVEIVDLEAGAISLSVRPLLAGERLVVKTADAEVEVRGTIFRVEAEASGIRSVEVSEGKVEVRFHGATWLLNAASRWTPPIVRAEASAPAGSARPVARATRAAQTPAPSLPTAAGEDDASTTLREGLRLADRGDYDAATKRLGAFCEAHPDDDRAEDAAFLIIVSMQRAGRRDEARAAAQRYLARYPGGYRRVEATAIAAGP